MTQLFLQPVDVWLFRDGRPFDPGSGRRAESLFPPYPTVIQGAIRSKQLTIKGVSLTDRQKIAQTVGEPLTFNAPPNYKGLLLRGPFLARLNDHTATRYYPQPADAVSVDTKRHQIRPASVPCETPKAVITSLPHGLNLLGSGDDLQKGESGLWLDEIALKEYLRGKTVTGRPASELFQRENRIGIGVNDTQQTVEEGLLYEVEFIRLQKDIGLLVEMNGYSGWPANGLLQVGGESRAAYYKSVSVEDWPGAPSPLPQFFKVYFATPAYFDNGWQPKNWSDFFDGKVTLRAAALHRYESVGGFDWAANPTDARAHRSSRRYTPAGSVYYFECESKAKLKSNLLQRALTNFGAEIGFGQIIIPAFNWKTSQEESHV